MTDGSGTERPFHQGLVKGESACAGEGREGSWRKGDKDVLKVWTGGEAIRGYVQMLSSWISEKTDLTYLLAGTLT